MNIDEAIESLEEEAEFEREEANLTMVDSIKLGIEALRRLKELRRYSTQNPKWLIPGETE